jgi:Tol biopolymer transport system component
MFRSRTVGFAAAACAGLALTILDPGDGHAADEPDDEEKAALKRLTDKVEGMVVYTYERRLRLLPLGQVQPRDLGPGLCARFSPDGRRLAAYDRGVVSVIELSTGARSELVKDIDDDDGCPIEFHSDGGRIVFVREDEGLFSVRILDRTVQKLTGEDDYTGEPGISADGKRLAARAGHHLYAIDLATGARRRYGRGCSPGVSPDGRYLMHNVNGHRRLPIESWDGRESFDLDADSCRPDRSWDNHHWSNHPNYIAAQGDRRWRAVYVLDVAANRGTRVTWERSAFPDLHIRRAPARGTNTAP